MNEDKNLIDQIRSIPQVAPPEEFTHRVMRRIVEAEPSRGIGCLFPSISRLLDTTILSVASRKECALFHMLTGVYHFFMGMVLWIGLKRLAAVFPLSGWITVQPILAIILGLGFLAAARIILKTDGAGLKVIGAGIWLYLALLAINSIILQKSFAIPSTAWILTIVTGIGFGMGLLLEVTLNTCRSSEEMEMLP